MEKERDKLLGNNTNKIVSVYYNDTYDSVSFKTGKFMDFDNNSILIMENKNQKATLIPRNKCIRIEIEEQVKAKIKAWKKREKNENYKTIKQ